MSATTLPAGVAELLQAIHDVLDVPLPMDEADDSTRTTMFVRRAGDIRVIVAHLLKSEYPDAAESAEQLLAWAAENPIAYLLWKDTREGESTAAVQDGGNK